MIETILCYKKNNYQPIKDKEQYSLDSFCWNIELLKECDKETYFGNKRVEIFYKNSYTISKVNPSIKALKETWATGTVLRNNASGKIFNNYISSRVGEDGLEVLYKVYDVGEDGLGYRFFTGPKKENATKGKFYSGVPLDRVAELKNGVSLKEKSISNYLEFEDAFGNCRQEGGVQLNAGKKPEALLKRIIEISTQEGDLVMDFFAGSGTTLAVAHKMKRRFIGIEQMDYIESITKERLKKVVAGEQGGISKAVDWQGGGSFIYAELMPLNAIYKERIKNINDEKMLDSIYKDLESKAFLDYRIDLPEILENKEFKELDLEKKKEALLSILDSNMDYVLYGDIEDKDYAISSEVIELNKIFYGDDNV